MQKVKWSAVIFTVGLLLILIFQNTEPVETRILFTSFIMPRAVLLLATTALGFLCGVILTMVMHKRKI
ncbi:MAG: LapA family protein [Desulfuromusa sp.]|jgi:putative membrane protein|nr:LapA family protein [Desulfuromusa sp.]